MKKNIQYFQAGEKIIAAGAMEKRMYIILDGSVTITLRKLNESVNIAELKKGDFFGEISLFANIPRSADVTANNNVKVVYVDNPEELNKFLIKNPAFAAKMVHILSKRLAKTNNVLMGKISDINRHKILREV